jgi:hypothetical protein
MMRRKQAQRRENLGWKVATRKMKRGRNMDDFSKGLLEDDL